MHALSKAILAGINAELASASEFVEFQVERSELEGAVWKVFVSLDSSGGYRRQALDESFEGSKAWWSSVGKNGVADVLSVIPEEEQINLRFASCAPPLQGGKLRIYPPRYLEALREVWSENEWAQLCLDRYQLIERGINAFDKSQALACPPFPKLKLRVCQKESFELPGWNFGYLWGPPGTGKTTTVGALIAAYVVNQPNARVLLLSTTNLAVDHALVAVDEALEQWALKEPRAARARKGCARLGNHITGKRYHGREHLLPVKDTKLVHRLVELEINEPSKSDVTAYHNWKSQVEAIRQAMRSQAKEVLQNARVAAMTTTRAVFTLDLLRESGLYDLIVFDEASQVGQAHALALIPLGRRVIFAGDPKQLAPIVTADDDANAKRWIGESMFREMSDAPSTCMLNEQSRMAEPICRVISSVFYNRELVVAADCNGNPEWLAARRVNAVDPVGKNAAGIVMVGTEACWSPQFGGTIRYESAEKIRELLGSLVIGRDQSEFLVLTRFRAQRNLIRWKLRQAGLGKINVSTVHRAQGSQRYTIIFDPVKANNGFDDDARLINVALSRAEARFILCLSPDDFQNKIIKEVALAIDQQGPPLPGYIPIEELARQNDFPDNVLGLFVTIDLNQGRVIALPNDRKWLAIFDATTGKVEQYYVDTLKANSKNIPTHVNSTVPRSLSTTREAIGKFAVGQIVECSVSRTNKGGLDVTLDGLRAFLPASQVELGFAASLESYVGQKLTVQIIESNLAKRNMVVSRRAVLTEQRNEREKAFWEEIEIGQQYTGKVKAIKEYGAFIDLGAADGFLHVGELSWKRVKHPSELLRQGEQVAVVVLSLDREKMKIGLGMRQLTHNTRVDDEERDTVGKMITGRVTSATEFGNAQLDKHKKSLRGGSGANNYSAGGLFGNATDYGE